MENYNINMDYDQILFKEEVARGTRLLREYGYSPSGESGDVSVRDARTGLVYISGSPEWVFQRHLGDARGWERYIIDLETGEKLAPWSSPTTEEPMHLAIYRARPDVEAIVHTHGPWTSIFAILNWDIPLVMAGDGETGLVRCGKYAENNTRELADYTVEALGDGRAALMSNHGAVAVGKNLDECFRNAAWLETAAQKAYYSLLAESGARVDLDAVVAKFSE